MARHRPPRRGGEPAFEAGALLRNPLPFLLASGDLIGITARRVWQLAEALELDRERVRAWGFVSAVLSACWTYEDYGDTHDPVLACADALRAVRV